MPWRIPHRRAHLFRPSHLVPASLPGQTACLPYLLLGSRPVLQDASDVTCRFGPVLDIVGVASRRSHSDRAELPVRRLSDYAGHPVEIRHSPRRKKTLAVSYEGDQLVAVLPNDLPEATAADAIARLVRRCVAARNARVQRAARDLGVRAAALADRYLTGVRPAEIHWASGQENWWGSCTPHTGVIRISSKLSTVPDWVLDGVVVHELAHLVVPSHSPQFKALVARYPKTVEVAIYLAGYGQGLRSRDGL